RASCQRSDASAGRPVERHDERQVGPPSNAALPSAENDSAWEDSMKQVMGLVLIAAVVITAAAAVAQQSAPQPATPPPGHQMPMQGGMCPMMTGMMRGGGMMSGMMGMMGDRPNLPG